LQRKYEQLCHENTVLRRYLTQLYGDTLMLYYLAGQVTTQEVDLAGVIYAQFELMQDKINGASPACRASFDARMLELARTQTHDDAEEARS